MNYNSLNARKRDFQSYHKSRQYLDFRLRLQNSVTEENDVLFATYNIFVAMIALVLSNVFIENAVVKTVYSLVYTVVVSAFLAFLISLRGNTRILRKIVEIDYLGRITSSLDFYQEANVLAYIDNGSGQVLSGDKVELVSFMDAYFSQKSDEITLFIQGRLEDIWRKQRKAVLFDWDATKFEKSVNKTYREIDTFVNEYEELAELFIECKISLAFMQEIEDSSHLRIEDIRERLVSEKKEKDSDEILFNPEITREGTSVTLHDIESMINDRDQVAFMRQLYRIKEQCDN